MSAFLKTTLMIAIMATGAVSAERGFIPQSWGAYGYAPYNYSSLPYVPQPGLNPWAESTYAAAQHPQFVNQLHENWLGISNYMNDEQDDNLGDDVAEKQDVLVDHNTAIEKDDVAEHKTIEDKSTAENTTSLEVQNVKPSGKDLILEIPTVLDGQKLDDDSQATEIPTCEKSGADVESDATAEFDEIIALAEDCTF